MNQNTSIAEQETEFINTAPEQIKWTKEQEEKICNYMRRYSTPLPLLGGKWRIPFELSEMIDQEQKQHQWLNIHEVTNIAMRNRLEHFGTQIDHFDLVEILRAAFRFGEKIILGPYVFNHRRAEVSRNGKKTWEDQYWVEVDPKEIKKYQAFLDSVAGDDTLEV